MKLLTLMFCVGLVNLCHAQNNFVPEDADLSFPRSIIDTSQIDDVRSKLSNELNLPIYTTIYHYAKSAIPEDNSTYQDRRLRSQIAREAAFVLLMDRGVYDNQVEPLSASEREVLLQHTLVILNEINTDVEIQEGWSFYFTWQFRSKELIHLLVAYDLLKGAGVADELLANAAFKLQTFSANLYEHTTLVYPNPIPGLPGIDFFFYNPNNHGIMVSSALGLAGIVLSDIITDNPNFQPAKWINSGLWNLDNLLWRVDGLIPRVSEPNTLAGYAEGPNYFYYGFQNAFPFIRAMWNYLPNQTFEVVYDGIERAVPHPWYDENYHNLYKWMILIRMPDGTSPAIHDSSAGFATMFTALSGEPSFNIPSVKGSYMDFWTRTQYLCTEVVTGTYDEPLFQALPEAGSLIFRNEYNNPNGIYMHLIGKNGIALEGAKNHHQADATSFQLYYNGHIFAIDEGYVGANYSSYVNKASDHNLILVDGKGPTPPLSEWTNNDNEVFIEDYFDLELADFGTLKASWQDAHLSRNVLFVEDQYFVIWDHCRSSYPRHYQFQLHASGLTTNDANHHNGTLALFPEEDKVILTKSDDQVALITQASNGAAIFDLALDSTYNGTSTNYHNKVLIGAQPVENLQFTSLIIPFSDSAPNVQTLENISDGNAMIYERAAGQDFIFSQIENSSRSIAFEQGQTLHTNALDNLISVNHDDKLRMIFMRQGDSIFWNNKPVVLLDQLRNLTIEFTENEEIQGFVNGPTELKFYSDTSMIAIEGDIGTSYYDPITNLFSFEIHSAGKFKLAPGEAIISDTSTPFSSSANNINLSVYPNPSRDFCTINIDGPYGIPFSYTLSDSRGQMILNNNSTVLNNNSQVHLDLTNLATGIYTFHVQQNGQLRSIAIQKAN